MNEQAKAPPDWAKEAAQKIDDIGYATYTPGSSGVDHRAYIIAAIHAKHVTATTPKPDEQLMRDAIDAYRCGKSKSAEKILDGLRDRKAAQIRSEVDASRLAQTVSRLVDGK